MSVFSPLAAPVFRRFWLGMTISTTGYWMQTITAAALMAEWTNGDAVLVSLVQTAMFFPVMVLALPGGLMADRIDRRKLLIFAHFIMALTPLLIAALAFAGFRSPLALLILVSCLAAGNAVKLPAQSAMVPDLVERTQLPQAIGLNSVAVNGGRIVGPALSAALLPLIGIVNLLILNAATYASFVGILLGLKTPSNAPTGKRGFRFVSDIGALIHFTRSHSPFWYVLLRGGLYFAVWSIVLAVLPLMSRSPAEFGLVYSCFGVGAISGALFMELIRKRLSSNSILTAAVAAHACFLGMLPLIDGVIAQGLLMWLVGLSSFYAMSTLQIAAQIALPAELRGRGLAAMNMVFMGATSLSSPVWGGIAHKFDAATAVWCAAGFSICAVLLTAKTCLLVDRPADHEAVGH